MWFHHIAIAIDFVVLLDMVILYFLAIRVATFCFKSFTSHNFIIIPGYITTEDCYILGRMSALVPPMFQTDLMSVFIIFICHFYCGPVSLVGIATD